MKTSTMFIVIAVLITLGFLTAYNLKIKEVYDSKEYKSRFRGMEFTPMSGIDELTVDCFVNPMSVTIEYGETEGVWILKKMKPKIKTEIRRHHLTLGWLPDPNKKDSYATNGVIIITKKLRSVVVRGDSTKNTYNGGMSEFSMSNYKLDQLDLKLSPNVMMWFNNLKINSFNATIGNETDKQGQLTLGPGSEINTAHFTIPGSGMLDLQKAEIKKVTYNVSAHARVMLSGKDLDVLKK